MRNFAFAVVLVGAATLPFLPAAQTAPPATHQVQLNGHTFTLPVGFEIEQVAGPPQVDRPIVADFDEEGRLYVADSSGTNDPVEQQLAKKPHRIVRLVDSQGTGHFDKQTVFADHMMFPEGTLWRDGSLYVAAPPSIWKLTDTQGAGVADQRIEWFNPKVKITGCANDLHGPYQGTDGWIYWCKGAFARQTYERPGKKPFVTSAAHIFRARPDGSGIEPVMTGGMDNPVHVVFTPGGERIFTTTFLQIPGGGRRDGLIHAVYGGVYGKEHGSIYEHPWTGPSTMPILNHLGPAAPSGLVRYESSAFGPEYQDNLFAALFNMRKVTRHVLTPQGATFATHEEDFLVSDNLDFHPTDLLEDADGSLLVIDTGGWYKLCCPSSQLHKPDVLGAIYRIRRTHAPAVADARGVALAWTKFTFAGLADLLGDARPVVRRRAIQTLANCGNDALPALAETLRSSKSAEARRNALWAACRIDGPAARALDRQGLADADETVRQVALHAVSVWRDAEATPALLTLLDTGSSHNQRAAAEALGRTGTAAVVPALLAACAKPAERTLDHSRIYAMIEIGARDAIAAGLTNANPGVRRAALTALDQLGAAPLEAVQAALNASDPALKETAWWIAIRHPEWGGVLADVLRARFAAPLSEAERGQLTEQLARFCRTEAVQRFLAERLADDKAPPELRKLAMRAMAQARLRNDVPASWATSLKSVLRSDRADLVPEAVATARAFSPTAKAVALLAPDLRRTAGQTNLPAEARLGALLAMAPAPEPLQADLFALALAELPPDKPVGVRALAADVLSREKLTTDQLARLTDALKVVGPLELDRLLEAFKGSTDEEVGRKLIAALRAANARSSLRPETLKPRLAKFGPALTPEAEALYADLLHDSAQQRAQLEGLLTKLAKGDIRRGQAVFQSQRAACYSCHSIGYKGGNVGPDLTRVGKIRSERDLLEAIVFPSASFVRSFEPMSVITKAGKTYNGLVRKDAPDELVLAINGTEEVHVARGDIEEVQPSKVSIMPAGLDKQLTPQELADLVAFLKACQ